MARPGPEIGNTIDAETELRHGQLLDVSEDMMLGHLSHAQAWPNWSR